MKRNLAESHGVIKYSSQVTTDRRTKAERSYTKHHYVSNGKANIALLSGVSPKLTAYLMSVFHRVFYRTVLLCLSIFMCNKQREIDTAIRNGKSMLGSLSLCEDIRNDRFLQNL
jgi:hypothetical protein